MIMHAISFSFLFQFLLREHNEAAHSQDTPHAHYARTQSLDSGVFLEKELDSGVKFGTPTHVLFATTE